MSSSLELDQVLNKALEKTLKVIRTQKAIAYLVDQRHRMSPSRQHTGAARVSIDIPFNPGEIRASITDDGRGFDVPDRMDDLVLTGKLGLIGMVERARLLGADLTIESAPRTGTSITVTLPLQPTQMPGEQD